NLLAVDAGTNRAKGDGDAATWLPPNKAYRCTYVAAQVAVKKKYGLWVTAAEKAAMRRVLSRCPDQELPSGGNPTQAPPRFHAD
uniref:HNH endonuclease family protein n=2 Tax=Streptomyces TaxID=1883 RepID=UPI00117BFB38